MNANSQRPTLLYSFAKPSTVCPDRRNSATSYAEVHPASRPIDNAEDASNPHSRKGDLHQSGVGAKAPLRRPVSLSPNARTTVPRRDLACLLGVYVYIIALMVTAFLVVYLFLKDKRLSQEESQLKFTLYDPADHSTPIPHWTGDGTETTPFRVTQRRCAGDCVETSATRTETLPEATSAIGKADNSVNATTFPVY
ncbi:hypothetical protein MTO96_048974 [Rhipicephalus appendiculatus]